MGLLPCVSAEVGLCHSNLSATCGPQGFRCHSSLVRRAKYVLPESYEVSDEEYYPCSVDKYTELCSKSRKLIWPRVHEKGKPRLAVTLGIFG